MSDFENIPDEKQARDQWLYWNASADKPRQPLESPAADYGCSWSDPDVWMSFDEVVEGAATVEGAGIGYVNAIANEDYPRGLYAVIDIDGCVDDEGRPKDWLPSLQPFFDHGAYMEFSPSGTGIHIPVVGLEQPDWWSDKHFSDDDHEGVDVLTNKFSTYTGDALRNCGDTVAEYGDWVDDWLLEAYKAITGEDPLEDTDADPEDVPDGSSGGQVGDRDEWMTESIAREALAEIDPDVSYSTWKDVGMALANHFGRSRGRSLFVSWSRRGSKWDSDAERQAERIINDAGNYNYDIGTLVYHASQHGWDASAAARTAMAAKRSDGGVATAPADDDIGPSGPEPDREWSLSPADVIKLAVDDPLNPIGYDEDGNITGGVRDLRGPEKAHYVWDLAQRVGEDLVLAQYKGPIYSYDDGVWRDDDEQWMRKTAGTALESTYSKAVKSELEEYIRMDRTKRPEELGAPDGTIVCESGLLDLVEREVRPVKPEHHALVKIPTEFDADAECPRWEAFVEESIPDDGDRQKFQEYAGYVLWRHAQDFGKAMFFVGPTDSGKGTALKAIRQVIGRENTASETLHDLIQTRWGTAQLFGNIVNIRNEVTPSGLGQVQKFKELTGGEDEVSAEFKGQDKFQMVITQKFMFSTNEVPTVKHADEAFYNRLLFVEFPNTVPPEEHDKQLLDKFSEERSGILNWMLDGLEALLEQGQFTAERSINGKKELCDAFGGVIDRFVHHCLMVTGDVDDTVKKADLHNLAQAYADDIDKKPEWDTQTGFSRQIAQHRGISQGQKRINGENHRVFQGVRVKPEVVVMYNQDITATSGDEDDPKNTALGGYGDTELRPGYDSTKSDDSADDDRDRPTGGDDRTNDDDSLQGEPIEPHIVHYVRENQGGRDGVPHDELVDALRDRGAGASQIDYGIEKALERGSIQQPLDSDDLYTA